MLTADNLTIDLLEKLINKDKNSALKMKMRESLSYFNSQNLSIMDRKKMMMLYDDSDNPYIKKDLSKANHKLVHSYHYELVNQCKNYLCGKPIKLSYKSDISEDIIKLIDDILYKDNKWTVFNQLNVKNAQLFSRAWFRVVVHNNKIRFVTLNPLEIIPFYDDFDDLTFVIRYYGKVEYDEKGNDVLVNYAEVYDKFYKYTYVSKNKGKYVLESSEPLFVKGDIYGDVTVGKAIELPIVPIIEWKLNEDSEHTMLEPIKPFIDMLDIDLSDLANNVDDIQDVVWILENYTGQNLQEFMEDLKIKKAIKVGEGGSVDTKEVNIPTEARLKLYEICEKNVYRFGFGVDFSKRDNLGNVSGVGLKWSYAPLDQKADGLENQGHVALNNLFTLLFFYLGIDYDSNDVEFVFNRTMISNEQEIVGMVMTSSALLSRETTLENHPMVDDVEEEIRRLNEEDQYYEDNNESDTATDDTEAESLRQAEQESDTNKVSET